MSDDLISRQAAIDVCDNAIDSFRGQFGAGVLVAIKESIEELPPAEPKTGKWVDDGDPLMLKCGNCGYGVMRYNNTPFCPNCGAKMDEVTT